MFDTTALKTDDLSAISGTLLTRHDPGGKMRLKFGRDVISDAIFSACERYRFLLSRTWNAALPSVMFLMMNPSVADLSVNDPTVAKCMRFAERWGYGRLFVGNVCAYRATDKRELAHVADPAGPGNIAALLRMAALADRVVVAHGRLPPGVAHHARAACDALQAAGVPLYALRVSKDGCPWHPLYLKETLDLQPWVRG